MISNMYLIICTGYKIFYFNPFILIDYPISIYTISLELSILYFKGLLVNISINDVFTSCRLFLFLANSAGRCKIPPCAAFHFGIHSLPKYLFTCIHKYKKGYNIQLL